MKRQNELAKELGISKSYLSMMLSGKRKIPEYLEDKICELVHKNRAQELLPKFESLHPLHVTSSSHIPFC
ncbi:MAG: helix-turn-helix transcriptional regulator [Dehalococcoidales bacterium]|nr:helix-turn-helix transcriptional regulator [Dehalococcoidales bacterium]